MQGKHYTTKNKPQLPIRRHVKFTSSMSLHTLGELSEELSGLDYAFLSPVFDSISKPGYTAAFESEALREAISKAACPIIALGGDSWSSFYLLYT